MSRSLSVYLNFLRVLAALLVLFSHLNVSGIDASVYDWAMIYGTGGDGVVIFFVLSGFVIAFTTERRPSGMDYFVARASRMWSVVVPVILITPLFYYLGHYIEPEVYSTDRFNDSGSISSAFSTLFFVNEFAGRVYRYYGNEPLWSISYEVAYYVLFGLMLYLRGGLRIVALAVIAALAGLKILLMFPLWLAGALLYKVSDRINLSLRSGILLIVGSVAIYAIFLTFRVQLETKWFALLSAHGVHTSSLLQHSRRFPSNYFVGLLICANIVGAVVLAKSFDLPAKTSRVIDWLADRSFALYAFHFPLMCLGAAILGGHRHGWTGGAAMALFAIGGCMVLAEISDLRKREWRRGVRYIATLIFPTAARSKMPTSPG